MPPAVYRNVSKSGIEFVEALESATLAIYFEFVHVSYCQIKLGGRDCSRPPANPTSAAPPQHSRSGTDVPRLQPEISPGEALPAPLSPVVESAAAPSPLPNRHPPLPLHRRPVLRTSSA